MKSDSIQDVLYLSHQWWFWWGMTNGELTGSVVSCEAYSTLQNPYSVILKLLSLIRRLSAAIQLLTPLQEETDGVLGVAPPTLHSFVEKFSSIIEELKEAAATPDSHEEFLRERVFLWRKLYILQAWAWYFLCARQSAPKICSLLQSCEAFWTFAAPGGTVIKWRDCRHPFAL